MNKHITLMLGITACLCSPGICRARPLAHATTTSPTTQSATVRKAPRAAAIALLNAIKQHDQPALCEVIAPSKAGNAEERARQTLDGKGKLGGLNALIREGASFTIAGERASKPEDGHEVMRIILDMKDKHGKDRKNIAALEIFQFEDGWRVDDFDRAWGSAK